MRISALRKSLVVFCLAVSAGMGLASIYLFYSYHYGTLPAIPRPDLGRVYPSNNHGSIVYLTQSENDLLNVLQFGGVIPFLVGFFLNGRWGVFPAARLRTPKR